MKPDQVTMSQTLELGVGEVTLEGDLAVPPGARGLVLFAHGSGSGRKSARNRFVAGALQKRGFATLHFDLLTAAEERRDAIDAHLHLDIRLLAERLEEATEWLKSYAPVETLPLGYFGESTGAAAALLAAAERKGRVGAVVSRGGRLDLVHDMLVRVRVPTLLIVGGRDTAVLEVNQEALHHLAIRRLAVVPGATHLFEEPGTLAQVAQLAGDWFVEHLSARNVCALPAPGA